MDRKFLTRMSESFYNDFTLKKSNIWDTRATAVFELNGYLINLMTDVRLEDDTLYHELHSLSKQKQYEVIYILLEEFINDEHPDNEIFEDVEPSLLMLEIGMFGGAAALTVIVSPLVYYLKEKYRGVINRTITTNIVTLASSVDKLLKYAGKLGGPAKARNAILYSNLDLCGKRCNVNDVGDMSNHIEAPMKGDKTTVSDATAMAQFTCLFTCFLQFNIQAGTSLFNQYNHCTKNQVNRNYQVYMTQPESNAAQCKDIYEVMVKHFKQYEDVIKNAPFIKDHEKQIFVNAYFSGDVTSLKNTSVFK